MWFITFDILCCSLQKPRKRGNFLEEPPRQPSSGGAGRKISRSASMDSISSLSSISSHPGTTTSPAPLQVCVEGVRVRVVFVCVSVCCVCVHTHVYGYGCASHCPCTNSIFFKHSLTWTFPFAITSCFVTAVKWQMTLCIVWGVASLQSYTSGEEEVYI